MDKERNRQRVKEGEKGGIKNQIGVKSDAAFDWLLLTRSTALCRILSSCFSVHSPDPLMSVNNVGQNTPTHTGIYRHPF